MGDRKWPITVINTMSIGGSLKRNRIKAGGNWAQRLTWRRPILKIKPEEELWGEIKQRGQKGGRNAGL